jgi:hypothetical protein
MHMYMRLMTTLVCSKVVLLGSNEHPCAACIHQEEKVCILESILHLKSAKQPMNPRGVDKEEAGSKCGERDSVAILHSSAHTKQNRYLPFSLCNLHYTMGCTH